MVLILVYFRKEIDDADDNPDDNTQDKKEEENHMEMEDVAKEKEKTDMADDIQKRVKPSILEFYLMLDPYMCTS